MIGDVVFAVLKTVFPGAAFASVFPQTDDRIASRLPASRFQIVSAESSATVCGTDDRHTDDTRVQVDIVASDWDTLSTKVDETITAMQGASVPCVRENYFTTFDEETRVHRASIDFVFYPSSAVSS